MSEIIVWYKYVDKLPTDTNRMYLLKCINSKNKQFYEIGTYCLGFGVYDKFVLEWAELPILEEQYNC